MILLFWIIGIVIISIIIGEIRFRQLYIFNNCYKNNVTKNWKENIDTDIGNLYIEKSISNFNYLKTIEYSKKL